MKILGALVGKQLRFESHEAYPEPGNTNRQSAIVKIEGFLCKVPRLNDTSCCRIYNFPTEEIWLSEFRSITTVAEYWRRLQ